jgi:hypothetical protein
MQAALILVGEAVSRPPTCCKPELNLFALDRMDAPAELHYVIARMRLLRTTRVSKSHYRDSRIDE